MGDEQFVDPVEKGPAPRRVALLRGRRLLTLTFDAPRGAVLDRALRRAVRAALRR